MSLISFAIFTERFARFQDVSDFRKGKYMFGLVAPGTIELLTAIASAVFTLLLLLLFRGRSSYAQACVIGIGFIPLVVYFAIFIVFHLRRVPPFGGLPWWESFAVIAVFIAPSYLASFVISLALVTRSYFSTGAKWATPGVCAILLAVHAVGLSWTYLFLTSKGSL